VEPQLAHTVSAAAAAAPSLIDICLLPPSVAASNQLVALKIRKQKE